MRYINKNSRRGVVNMFADYILSNIDKKYNSIIQVVDFKSFFVVCGQTGSPLILDLNKIKETFYKTNEKLLESLGFKTFNTIDLIEYKEPIPPKTHYFKFYNSQRPLFHEEVVSMANSNDLTNIQSINYTNGLEVELIKEGEINVYTEPNSISVSSTFPYGHSLNMGRIQLYYSEYICNQLLHSLVLNEVEFKYTENVNQDDDLDISFKCNSIYDSDEIKSMVLDIFDFNIERFKSLIVGDYNFENDLNNQLIEKPWLIKDRIKELIPF